MEFKVSMWNAENLRSTRNEEMTVEQCRGIIAVFPESITETGIAIVGGIFKGERTGKLQRKGRTFRGDSDEE